MKKGGFKDWLKNPKYKYNRKQIFGLLGIAILIILIKIIFGV